MIETLLFSEKRMSDTIHTRYDRARGRIEVEGRCNRIHSDTCVGYWLNMPLARSRDERWTHSSRDLGLDADRICGMRDA